MRVVRFLGVQARLIALLLIASTIVVVSESAEPAGASPCPASNVSIKLTYTYSAPNCIARYDYLGAMQTFTVPTGITPVFTIGSSVSGDTVADSDSTTLATFVNPTIDAGVVPKGTVSIGDRVWRDRNGDGIQGPRDHGVAGAVLRLFNSDGTPVVDAFGRPVKAQRTKANGKFLFENLLPGRYTVRITYPKKWQPTTANSPGRGRNSSTTTAQSLVLAAGQSDKTLDFGVVFRGNPLPGPRLPSTL